MKSVSKNLVIKGKTVLITLPAKVWRSFGAICKKENTQEADLAARIWKVKGKSKFSFVIQLFVFLYNQPKKLSKFAFIKVLKHKHKQK